MPYCSGGRNILLTPRERYRHGGNVPDTPGNVTITVGTLPGKVVFCCRSARSQENGNDPTQPGPWNLPGFFGGVPCDPQPQRRVAPNSTSFKVVSRAVDHTYPRQRPRKLGYVFNWKIIIAEEAYHNSTMGVQLGFWFEQCSDSSHYDTTHSKPLLPPKSLALVTSRPQSLLTVALPS